MSIDLFAATLRTFTTIEDDALLLEHDYMRVIRAEQSNFQKMNYMYYKIYKGFIYNGQQLRKGNIIAIKSNGDLHVQ